jgi:MFS family permease
MPKTPAAPVLPLTPEQQHVLRWEGLRNYLERPARVATSGGGVMLLIAIQHFGASANAKAWIAGASFIGLLASPLIVGTAARLGLSLAQGLAAVMALAALALAGAGLSTSFEGFFVGVLIGAPLITASAPLITALWQDRIPGQRRGRLFARVTSLAGVVGVISSAAIAAWLELDVSRFRPVLLGMAGLLLLAALASLRIRSGPVETEGGNPYRVLRLAWREPRFGMILIGWFLLGFGNLATMPLRLEHVGGVDAVFGYGPQTILWLTQVIPQAVALLATLYWGSFFDRFDFLVLRVVLNLFFAASILCFFTPWLWLQVLGAVLSGIGMGGGSVIWGLWVTRYAPDGRTADYMAVHTFLTGVRGILGPIAAYQLIERLPLVSVTQMGVALILVSALLFSGLQRNRPESLSS